MWNSVKRIIKKQFSSRTTFFLRHWGRKAVSISSFALHGTRSPLSSARCRDISRWSPWKRASFSNVGFVQLHRNLYFPLKSISDWGDKHERKHIGRVEGDLPQEPFSAFIFFIFQYSSHISRHCRPETLVLATTKYYVHDLFLISKLPQYLVTNLFCINFLKYPYSFQNIGIYKFWCSLHTHMFDSGKILNATIQYSISFNLFCISLFKHPHSFRYICIYNFWCWLQTFHQHFQL